MSTAVLVDIVAVVGGLVILLWTGDLLVRGAVALAERLNIPALIIGLTIVAFGTSAPELVVGIQAGLASGTNADAAGIALGNVVGSNIANVLLVLGVPAIIYPMCCNQPAIRRNTFMMLGATFIFIALCFDGGLSTLDGAILFFLILAYLAYSAHRVTRERKPEPAAASPAKSADDDEAGEMASELEDLEDVGNLPRSNGMIALYILGALIGLPIGANLVVNHGVDLAYAVGISPTVIGLSVIALGTSLPELATTVVAALRKHSAVALGNVIGSNLFNLLAVMGITALVAPIDIPLEDRFLSFDLWVMVAASLLLLPYVLGRFKIGRVSGVLFCIAYVAFVAFLFHNAAPTAQTGAANEAALSVTE